MTLNIRYRKENGEEVVYFSGGIDESTGQALSKLGEYLGNPLVFDFEGIGFLNSLGIRMWVDFLRHFEEGREIIFQNCSPEVLSQINIFPSFVRSATIRSINVPFICDSCGHESLLHLQKGKDLPESSSDIPLIECPKCGEKQHIADSSSFDFVDLLAARR